MKTKQIIKILVDVGMTAALLMLMAYSLIGEAAHEWIGLSMVLLFILHHILNIQWCKNLFKGRYTPFRVLQTILLILMLLCMIGSMLSGIVLSRHALPDAELPISSATARSMHMISAYWGFVIMSLHLGLHWNMMMTMGRKLLKNTSKLRTWALRIAAFAIACYGVYAFVVRNIGDYMFLKTQFVFFDFDEPLILFFLDYLAIMGLFVCIGHYAAAVMRKIK